VAPNEVELHPILGFYCLPGPLAAISEAFGSRLKVRA
jgi:hypothetical protein